MTTTSNLKPVYLILSEQAFLRKQAVERLRARLEEEGPLDFNLATYDAAATDPAVLVAACNTLPFAAPHRLVIVQGIEEYSAAQCKVLDAYVREPCQTTILCLVGTKLNKSTALYKDVAAAGGLLDRKVPERKRLPSVIIGLFAERGMRASLPVAQALMNATGDDLDTINQSIVQVKSYLGKRATVSVEDIAAVVAPTAEVKVWEFADALADKNPERALARFQTLLRMRAATPTTALISVTYTLRELVAARAALDRPGSSPQRAQRELAAIIDPKRSWIIRNRLKQAARFSGPELRAAYLDLYQVAFDGRTGHDDRIRFEAWIARFCAGGFR